MTNPANLYLIWYGNWPKFSRKKPVVARFLKALGNTPYYWINSNYTQANGEHVSRSLTVAQEIVDPYSLGKNIQDSDVATIVSNAITNNSGFQTSSHIPDINGIYVVITSSDVRNYSGFLTSYCGWHTVATMSKVATKFIFAGDPSSDMSVCAPPSNRKQSPNGYPGMDALASTLAHEISETVTDPELTAWMDSNNRENADLCAWQYGTTYASNSALANLRFAYNDYLIQENWSLRKGGLCDLK